MNLEFSSKVNFHQLIAALIQEGIKVFIVEVIVLAKQITSIRLIFLSPHVDLLDLIYLCVLFSVQSLHGGFVVFVHEMESKIGVNDWFPEAT